MSISIKDYEKLGAFYLGKEYDQQTKSLQEDLLLYDSKDLVTHGVVLGMTGSGKTGLCLSILEEAAMDNIPAIVIDPKGDIANLMLAFPDLAPEDFQPWINEDDARKNNQSPQEYATQTAKNWQEGLQSWGQDKARIQTFRDKVDINLFTPGSKAGIPVSILSSLVCPAAKVLDDSELLGDHIESTVSSLLSLLDLNTDTMQSEEAVLLSNIFQYCWQRQEDLTLENLIRFIQKPPFRKIGIIDLETFYPPKKRQDLALKFNALLASPSFSAWLEGPSLDIHNMLYQENGKARVSIFSIAHLSESERMFFLTILLNQMVGWMREQSGTSSLRALLYMDEIYGFLPPTANPPSKKPLLTMLKQGRAYGLGCLLATQNPVDLDYKALSNIGTWWLGRLQTERDKKRVLDGLEGAASSQEGHFDRKATEELLAGLNSRVFLMNNIHEDAPVVFHVRWVMSYLRGPLTRSQIKVLMDPKRAAFQPKPIAKKATSGMSMSAAAPETPKNPRPMVGDGIEEYFAPIAGETEAITYQPHLLREAEVYFSSTKAKLDSSRSLLLIHPMEDSGVDWQAELNYQPQTHNLLSQPEENVNFADLPSYAMNAKNYKIVHDEFEDWIYRNERAEILYSPLLKQYSKMDETESQFRSRIVQQARETRDEALDDFRTKMQKKINSKQGQLARALEALSREESQADSAKLQAGMSILGAVVGLFAGKRKLSATNIRRGRSSLNSTSRAMQQRHDVKIAGMKAEDLRAEITELELEMHEESRELEAKYDPLDIPLETISVKPYKKDIQIETVALIWLPYNTHGQLVANSKSLSKRATGNTNSISGGMG